MNSALGGQRKCSQQGKPPRWQARIARADEYDRVKLRAGLITNGLGFAFTAAIYGFVGQMWVVPEGVSIAAKPEYFMDLTLEDQTLWPPPHLLASEQVERASGDLREPA